MADRRAMRKALQASELNVLPVEASDLDAGLRLLAEATVDCVVLRQQLPELDVLAFLNALPVGERIWPPVICVMDAADKRLQIEMMSSGAVDVLSIEEMTPVGLRQAILRALPHRGYYEAAQSAKLERTGLADQLHLILGFLPIATYACRPDGDFSAGCVSESITRLTGYEPSQFASDATFWSDRIHPDDAHIVLTTRQSLERGGYQEIEYRVRVADGGYRWFYDHMLMVERPQVGPQIIGMWQDINERKAAEQALLATQAELQQSQKLESIGALAAGIAHEINTPMQYIGDNLHFLGTVVRKLIEVSHALKAVSEDPAVPAPVGEKLRELYERARIELLESRAMGAHESAVQGVDAVRRIVQAMKGFAHRDSGESAPADLNEALDNTITVCRNEWKYVAEVSTELDPTLPLVPCRIGEIKQVFLNLIINAAHAIADRHDGPQGERGKIVIRTCSFDDFAEIAISDTGIGIRDEIRSRIFDPFFTTKEVGRGSGQGLAIARSVVEQMHRGELRFESVVGEGTTFFVRLPLEERKEKAA
jgi:PAS domain S-box-containing protein